MLHNHISHNQSTNSDGYLVNFNNMHTTFVLPFCAIFQSQITNVAILQLCRVSVVNSNYTCDLINICINKQNWTIPSHESQHKYYIISADLVRLITSNLRKSHQCT